jgi:hypothetical protein
MATATTERVADLSPLWQSLISLPWSQVPSDLTEIDAHWCYCRLITANKKPVSDLVHAADWDAMNGFAQSLRAIWGRRQA